MDNVASLLLWHLILTLIACFTTQKQNLEYDTYQVSKAKISDKKRCVWCLDKYSTENRGKVWIELKMKNDAQLGNEARRGTKGKNISYNNIKQHISWARWRIIFFLNLCDEKS